MTWDVEAGRLDFADGVLEPGLPIRMDASCKGCGHRWSPRGSVLTLIVEDEE